MTIIVLCAVLIMTATTTAVLITAGVIFKRIKLLNQQMLLLTDNQTTASRIEYQLLLKNFFHVLENLAHTYALEIHECEKKEDFELCASLLESQQKIRKAQDIITAQSNAVK